MIPIGPASSVPPTTVLSATLSLDSAETVLVVADGSIDPLGNKSEPLIYVGLHSSPSPQPTIVTNSCRIRYLDNPASHSFQCIGLVDLTAGIHTFVLYAQETRAWGGFEVNAASGLAIIRGMGGRSTEAVLGADSDHITYAQTRATSCCPGAFHATELPTMTVLSNAMPPLEQAHTTTLASGNVYRDGASGDALLGIYQNGACFNTHEGTWGINDLFDFAEVQAPIYVHRYGPSQQEDVRTLEATRLFFCGQCVPLPSGQYCPSAAPSSTVCNCVNYKVGADARLITVANSTISGSAPLLHLPSLPAQLVPSDATSCCPISPMLGSPWCWATSTGQPSCPNGAINGTVQPVPLARATITLPGNEPVFLTAKARMQAHFDPAGSLHDSGDIYLWITVDGQALGTVGKQQIKYVNNGLGSESARVMCASFPMNSDSTPSAPGPHEVVVWAWANVSGGGSFNRLEVYEDQILVWFN
ncbi:MAG: hypothetical protein AAF628_16035 [Planctomycetota bacterium]